MSTGTTNKRFRIGKLIWLAAALGPRAPIIPGPLRPFVSQVEVIESLRVGLQGAAVLTGIPEEQLRNLIESGEESADVWEDPTPEGYRLAVIKAIVESELYSNLEFDEKIRLGGQLNGFRDDSSKEDLFVYEEHALSDPPEGSPEIEHWETGFTPVDLLFRGVTDGLLVLMAKPGVGKTSTLLSMAEAIKMKHPEMLVHFFEVEITSKLMFGRMAPIYRRGQPFKEGDTLHTGHLQMSDIFEKVARSGTKNQVVFVDSPDAIAGQGLGDQRRHDLAYMYRQMVAMKDHARLVIATSQPRKKEGGRLTMEDMSESWQKAWYADMIAGISQVGEDKMVMNCIKNRFGPSGGSVTYQYRLHDLSWEVDHMEEDDWF